MAWASVNCSRNQGSIMAVSSGRPQVFMLYQRGRGHEPVTVAGSIRSLVAVKAIGLRVSCWLRERLSRREARMSKDELPCEVTERGQSFFTAVPLFVPSAGSGLPIGIPVWKTFVL